MNFGHYIRRKRLARQEASRSYSLRQVALRIGVEPSYLSKVERDETPPPSEEKILRLARELDIDPDYLLSLAGKVAGDLKNTIRERPQLFGRLIRELSDAPDDGVALLTDRAQAGDW
jgi:transcriptional regulator with XRE-family HTH domain